MKRILIIDDSPVTLIQLEIQLTPWYEISLADSGDLGLQIGRIKKPDLILLDVVMPDMDGFATILAIKQDPLLRQVPVIFLTSDQDPKTEIRALESGAVDFILKPVNQDILLHRIELHLQFTAYQHHLEHTLEKLEDTIIFSFTELANCKGDTEDEHLPMTGDYVEFIGQELLNRGTFGTSLTKAELALIIRAVPFHDIGKIGVSDLILLKPGPLSPEEYKEAKKHTLIGGRMLGLLYERNPGQEYLRYAQLIAQGHHERFDGSGYPHGLAGEAIPLCCRIVAVANVYAACISHRVYRPAHSHAEARQIIIKGKGTDFDPRIVEIIETLGDTLPVLNKKIPLSMTKWGKSLYL